MFDEIDYILEGKNAERFATLYSHGKFWNISFIQFLIIISYLCIHPSNMIPQYVFPLKHMDLLHADSS
jgi:hypothetical protein